MLDKAGNWLTDLWDETRAAWRTLARRPTRSTAVVVVLGAGIGISAATCSVVRALAFQPLPHVGAERLVTPVSVSSGPAGASGLVSYPQFLEWRDDGRLFERLALLQWIEFDLTLGEESERVSGAWVSEDYFPVMQAGPLVGRLMDHGDFGAQSAKVVVVSERFWRRRLHADRGVVGRSLLLDDTPYTVVGIAREELLWPSHLDVWVPLNIAPMMLRRLQRFDAALFESIGRLRDGVTRAQARQRVAALAVEQARAHPEVGPAWSADVLPLRDRVVPPAWRTASLVLLAAVAFLQLLCCANVAHLLLAAALERRGDVATRLAMGATRPRAVRQVVVEALLLVAVSAAAGACVTAWLVEAIGKWNGTRVPNATTIGPGWETAAFALAVAVVVALPIAAAAAAGALKGASVSILRGASREGATPAGRRARALLVAGQVGLSVVLLLCAGLMLRSLDRLNRIDPGFDSERLLALRIRTPPGRYPSPAAGSALADRLSAALLADGSVDSVGMSSSLPAGAGGMYFQRPVLPDGLPDPPASRDVLAHWVVVTPSYFAAVGTRIVAGRGFDERDGDPSRPVIVVNESLARQLFPDGRSPVGRRLRAWRDGNLVMEVVGVAAGVRHLRWTDEFLPVAYVPQRQAAIATNMVAIRLRPGADPGAVLSAVRARVNVVDPAIAVLSAEPMTAVANRQMAGARFGACGLVLFASFGCLLACAGVHAVASLAVTTRTRELGIRAALGARPRDLAALVARQAVGPVIAGVACGVAAALGLTSLMRSMLYGVEPTDPTTFLTVPVIFAAVAVCASLAPARRAACADPAATVRAE